MNASESAASPTRSRPGCLVRGATRLGLLFLGLVVALLLGELFVRAAGLEVPPRGKSNTSRVGRKVPEAEVPGVRFMLTPGKRQEVVYPGLGDEPDRVVEYAINAGGFRDHPYERARPEGTFRVVVLGDSFTYGTGVDLDATYPKVMERRFAQLEPDCPTQVLNWGVYAYNTRQEVALLRHRVRDWAPDLVLLCLYVNDASGENRGAADGGGGPAVPREPPWELRLLQSLGLTSGIWDESDRKSPAQARTMALRRRSRLADLLAHRAYGYLRGRVTVRGYREDWQPGSPGLAMVEEALDDAVELARAEGFRLHATMYPDLNELSDNYPYRDAHARAEALCAERGVPFHDLLPLLIREVEQAGGDEREFHAHAHDKHPNPRCHRLVGEELARRLLPELCGEVR